MMKLGRFTLFALLLFVLSAQSVAAQAVNCDGIAEWTAGTVFFPGDRTVFEDGLYESNAIIHTVEPTTWEPNGWGVFLGECGGDDDPDPDPDPDPDAVGILGQWTAGTSHGAPAGDDRLLVLTAHIEHDLGISVTNVTYGGQAMDFVGESSAGNGFTAYTAIFVLDEAGISSAINSNFVATFTTAPFRTPAFSSVFLENVDAETPIGAVASNGVVGPGTVSTSSLSTNDGDLVILAATNGNTGGYSVNNGFSEAVELAIPSADGVAASLSATGNNVTPSATHTNANRQSIVGVVVQAETDVPPDFPAPGNLRATPVSQTRIDLEWEDGFSPEDGFIIERSVMNGTFGEVATVGENVTSFADTGLSPNTLYTYRVVRFSGAQRATSNTDSAMTFGTGGGGGCPVWSPRLPYNAGDVVLLKTTFFMATVDQGPGVSGTPTDSSFFWDAVPSCPGGFPTPGSGPGLAGVLSEEQFELMFPARNPFYTYQGLLDAVSVAGLTIFAGEGGVALRRREIASALANFSHETGGLFFVREVARPTLCDADSEDQWPCEPGESYFGRGPIQLSWNFNYGPAGVFVNQPLLQNPDLVATVPSIAWQSAIWYWVTQEGPGDRPAHDCVLDNQGFGCTIRSINGALECDGGNPAQVQSRIDNFESFKLILGATSVGPDGC